jgi:uncharacterized protein with FMN-binding domain
MKKLLLSALTVAAFIAYAVFQRATGEATGPLSGMGTSRPAVGGVSEITYDNGKYAGDVANTSWGDIQVQVVIDQNRIASVSAVEYPQDRPLSTKINQLAMPMLEQEAVRVQSAEVALVTGATVSSEGFIQSLESALTQAGG